MWSQKGQASVVSKAAVRHGNHELPCRTAERVSDRYPHPFGHDHQRVEGRTEGVTGSGRFGVCLFLGRKRKIKKWLQKGFDIVIYIRYLRFGNRAITWAPQNFLQFFQGLSWTILAAHAGFPGHGGRKHSKTPSATWRIGFTFSDF